MKCKLLHIRDKRKQIIKKITNKLLLLYIKDHHQSDPFDNFLDNHIILVNLDNLVIHLVKNLSKK